VATDGATGDASIRVVIDMPTRAGIAAIGVTGATVVIGLRAVTIASAVKGAAVAGVTAIV